MTAREKLEMKDAAKSIMRALEDLMNDIDRDASDQKIQDDVDEINSYITVIDKIQNP